MNEFNELSREDLILQNVALKLQVKQLAEEIEALKKQIGGPGAPPPATPLPSWVKANRTAMPKVERKKREFAHVRPRSEATRQVVHAEETCPDCGRGLKGGTQHHTREVIDLPAVAVEVVEHQFHTRWCGVCKKQVPAKSDLSSVALGKSRLGVKLMSLVAHLRTECRLPTRSIRALLAAQFGVTVSRGEITDILHRVARAGAGVVAGLLEEIRTSPVVHADETGWREDGMNGYVWSFSTPSVRYYVRDASRGSKVVKEALTEGFTGRLVTDFYGAYSFYLGEHQRCWVHLLRDLHELTLKHPGNQSVEMFVTGVRSVYDRARAFTDPIPKKRAKARSGFRDELRMIARPFLKQPVRQRVLAHRLENFAHQLFVFVEYEEVPPDNNAAERAIRPAVIARKISGGTRSEAGSDTMSALRTLFATWQLRGYNPLECCRLLLTGKLSPSGNPA